MWGDNVLIVFKLALTTGIRVATLPLLLYTLMGRLGDVNRSSDSCSVSFFLRRSMTFELLLPL